MKYFILITICVFNQIASANFILIKHSQFVKLDDSKQIFYVKSLRSSVSKLMSSKKETAFLEKNMPLLEIFMNQAIAAETKDCIVGGHLGKIDPSGKKCIKSSQAKCVVAGYIGHTDIANERCGSQLGVKSMTDLDLTCAAERVGTENKYPCLPVHIYGYDSKGGVICVADNPSQIVSRYLSSCQNSADKYPETTRNAASVIILNSENYSRLDQAIHERCRNLSDRVCKTEIAALEDAASYVSATGLNGQEENPRSNRSTK